MIRGIHVAAVLALSGAFFACGDSEGTGAPPPPQPVCGDGTVDFDLGEECDDGGENSDSAADACRTDCKDASCGDGVVDERETCDDGNSENGDACTNACDPARCGDGILTAGSEECDDGLENRDGEPNACRRDCTLPTCGDGLVDDAYEEECDDANDRDNDKCTNGCKNAVCGDGVIQRNVEECDDGLMNSDTQPGACRTSCLAAHCGDNVKDSGEQCDDGNVSDEDACLNTCRTASCGDGRVQAGVEQCDEGPANSDTRSNACRKSCNAPSCGDDVTDAGEVCDDGNDANEDSCLTTCDLNRCGDGFTWIGQEECDAGELNADVPGSPCRSTCKAPFCGDTIADGDEQCDDGNRNERDACLTTCASATCGDGFVWTDVEQCDLGPANSDEPDQACRTTCIALACGDGVVDTGEECDDGAANDDEQVDACRTSCKAAACGDGVMDTGEACDDGNLVEDDGCSPVCEIELLFPVAGKGRIYRGAIENGDSTFSRPELNDQYGRTCSDMWLWEDTFYYDLIELKNDTGEDQSVVVEGHWTDGILYVYTGEFDEGDPLTGCLSAGTSFNWEIDGQLWSNTGGASRVIPVAAEETLFVVVTAYEPFNAIGDWTVIIDNVGSTGDDDEPNDDSGAAVALAGTHHTVGGTADGGDEDWYAFDGREGERYRIEVLGELGNCYENYLPSSIEVYDENSDLLASSYRHPYYADILGTGCAGTMFSPRADATYYLRVAPSDGESQIDYYLHVRPR